MSNLVQRLDITAHPKLEKSLGYEGDSRWLAWHWEPEIEQLMCTDGHNFGTGKSMAWRVFLQHNLVLPAVEAYQLAESDRYWLILDRQTRNIYVGEAKTIQGLLEQPESLALLACLDGNNNPIKETAIAVKQTVGKITRLSALNRLKNFIPFGIAATFLGALGIGTGLWVIPTVQHQLAQNKIAVSPISADATCGIGGSGDFSAFVSSSVGDKELHVIGVYEARSDHGGNNDPTGAIEVKVERQNKPIILALSAYEPVRWNITAAPGAIISKIILNGYHNQTISGISGIPVEEYTYDGTGNYLGNFMYKWGSVSESTNTPSLVTKLEQINQANLTSFQGCYRGTSFSLK